MITGKKHTPCMVFACMVFKKDRSGLAVNWTLNTVHTRQVKPNLYFYNTLFNTDNFKVALHR